MPSVEQTAQYFDANADRLRAHRLVDKSRALKELLFDKLAHGSRVMEVGAGTGLYTARLLADGHTVLAVDLSSACLEQISDSVAGTEAADRLTTWHGDFMAVPGQIPSGSLDAVTFVKVLHHFPDSRTIAAALRTAYDLLAAGGKILIFEPNGSHPLWTPALLMRGVNYWKNERNVRLIRRRFLEGILRSLPGAEVRCRYRFVIPGGIVSRIPALDSLDRRICAKDHRWLDRIAINIALEAIKPC